MNSAKNTVVAILLLGVSYGVYQVINAPEGSDPLGGLIRFSSGAGTTEPAAGEPASAADDWNAAARPAAPPVPDLKQIATLESGAGRSPSGFEGLAPPPVAGAGFSAEPLTGPVQPPTLPPALPSLSASHPVPDRGTASISNGLSPVTREPESAAVLSAPAASGGMVQSPAAAMPGSSPLAAGVGDDTAHATVRAVPPGNSYAATPPVPLESLWPTVNQLASSGNFRGALERLTPYHERTSADAAGRGQLNEWLDALAAKVVYSTEHHLRPAPYVVQAGDTLDSIAQAWRVPAQLVYNVNRQQIANPTALQPGTEFKAIPGPFRAVAMTSSQELTLYADGLYAGRFRITSGVGQIPQGTWRVKSRQAFGHASGDFCLELDAPGLVLCASGSPTVAPTALTFSPTDAEELFGILSVDSEITVR